MRFYERLQWRILLASQLGWDSVFYFLKYKALKACGFYRWQSMRRARLWVAEELLLKRKNLFRAPSQRDLESIDSSQVIDEAEHICDDFFFYFSKHCLKRPHDWRSNPQTQSVSSSLRPWTQIPDFDKAQGDIKWIWEASRFDWIFILGRAYRFTGDARYQERFLFLVQDWAQANPPYTGQNWRDGQEASLRIVALIFALDCFALPPNDTLFLSRLIYTHLKRVDLTLDYALAQRNNHGLSEALALFMGALSFPELKEAPRWKRLSLKLFQKQVFDQFSEDGWYAQQSLMYTRFALRLCLLFVKLAKDHQIPLSPIVLKRLEAASQLLYQMENEGHMPNYGANDGTSFMRLTATSYLDFRPTLASLHYFFKGEKLYGATKVPENLASLKVYRAIDEELIWLFGSASQEAPSAHLIKEAKTVADESGVIVLRPHAEESAFIRCASYRHRPSHADSLHFDFWKRGKNILVDSGTFQYFDDKNWGAYFKSTAAHNTVVVAGRSQMLEFSRFLWADWLEAKILPSDEPSLLFRGEHYGYKKKCGVIHRRSIFYAHREWRIVDDLFVEAGRGPQTFELRWHLAEPETWLWPQRHCAQSQIFDIQLELNGAKSDAISWKMGPPFYPESGASSYYGEIHPIGLLSLVRESDSSFQWVTTLKPLHDHP